MPGNAAIADNAGNAGNPKRQIAFGSGDCPTEVKRVTDWEYLAARNQAKRTIERSRHHAVREMAAKCPRATGTAGTGANRKTACHARPISNHQYDVHGDPAGYRRS
jgi:hypothetical protein